MVFDIIVANWTNDENHRYNAEHENNIVNRMFIFNLVLGLKTSHAYGITVCNHCCCVATRSAPGPMGANREYHGNSYQLIVAIFVGGSKVV